MLISWMTFCVLSSLNGSRSLTYCSIFAPYQHEVEYKDQYEDVDGKTADTSHDGLPDAGRIEMTYATVSFPRYSSRFGFNDVGRF